MEYFVHGRHNNVILLDCSCYIGYTMHRQFIHNMQGGWGTYDAMYVRICTYIN